LLADPFPDPAMFEMHINGRSYGIAQNANTQQPAGALLYQGVRIKEFVIQPKYSRAAYAGHADSLKQSIFKGIAKDAP
jgi:hypothetical protein